MANFSSAALSYHEPDIVTILIQSSFLLLLNGVNYILDRIVYCGLIGQILVGIAWGTPGGKWVGEEVEHVVVQLGYLGLILLVYEGGLSTSFPSLKANILLSLVVATLGIVVPIALSFTLQGLVGASPLQAFAAGAALCSTSLGTTFTILGTSGLTNTRLGTVLTSAAMMDDVIGLVMVQVISNLGASKSSFDAVTIIRPVFVSIAFAVVCPLVCRLVIAPLTERLNRYRAGHMETLVQRLLTRHETAFIVHSCLLLSMVTGATYAGTSNLFAAYLSGAMVSWWDSECGQFAIPALHEGEILESRTKSRKEVQLGKKGSNTNEAEEDFSSGKTVYRDYYSKAVDRILKPFFFASVGFSIPITRMFSGNVVWRGIIYALLMVFGKLICGLYLVRFSLSLPKVVSLRRLVRGLTSNLPHFWGKQEKPLLAADSSTPAIGLRPKESDGLPDVQVGKGGDQDTRVPQSGDDIGPVGDRSSQPNVQSEAFSSAKAESSPLEKIVSPNPSKPFSLYPAFILGLAMVSRGEIGFLISSVAQSGGVFSSYNASRGEATEDIFLIVTWAIVLCTLIGPVGVGLLVRRVRRLEKTKEVSAGGGRDILGVWGVS